MPADRVLVGIVLGAQGVRGRVRVKTFTEQPQAIAAYGALSDETGARRFVLRHIGDSRGAALAEIDGVADRDAAEALKGLRLYADRSALPPPEPGEFYHADLIGLRVVEEGGAVLGTVKVVFDFGAGPLLEVALAGRRGTAMLPFTDAVVPKVDLAAGELLAVPPPGLLEPPGPRDDGEREGQPPVGRLQDGRARGPGREGR